MRFARSVFQHSPTFRQKLLCAAHPPVVSHKPPSPFIFQPLTCSCNSANRCCRSCSESSPEDSDSEELELSSSDIPGGGGTCRVEGAGWRTIDGVGTGVGSSGSSGILAKRISNTSFRGGGTTGETVSWTGHSRKYCLLRRPKVCGHPNITHNGERSF